MKKLIPDYERTLMKSGGNDTTINAQIQENSDERKTTSQNLITKRAIFTGYQRYIKVNLSQRCKTQFNNISQDWPTSGPKIWANRWQTILPTSHLSNLIDILIKPLITFVRSNLRDSTEFINKLPGNVPNETILNSFDITGLYANIPHDLGIKAIKCWLTLYPGNIPRRLLREFVIEGINLILNNNTFVFNDTTFLQKKGTEMGIKMAPSYATLVLGYLEENIIKQKKYSEIWTGSYIKDNWFRYLNDCFINWIFVEDKLRQFHILLNSLDPNIQFTIEQSTKQLVFLDRLMKKDNDRLSTDIYYKATDTRQYLDYTSNHPRHIKRNIPYNLARRICTFVDDVETKNTRLKELEDILSKGGYPPKK